MPATTGKFGLKDDITPSGRRKERTLGLAEDYTREAIAAAQAQRETGELTRNIASQLFTESTGLRRAGIDEIGRSLVAGIPPTLLDQTLVDARSTIAELPTGIYARGREELEDQYNVARENVLSRIPTRGGELNERLTDLESARAGAVGRLETDISAQEQQQRLGFLTGTEIPLRSQIFSAALSLGQGVAPQVISGFGTAGALQGGAAGNLNTSAGGFTRLGQVALAEQLEREKRSKEEVQQIAQAVGTKGVGAGK